MNDYTLSTQVPSPFLETVDMVREALSEQGFGIITEIDMAATLKSKIDVDVTPLIILGACRPELAHQALVADPSIAAMLPCNVVVRSVDADTTAVEAFDPGVMTDFGGDAIREVAQDASDRLTRMLDSLTKEP